ncbi:MAG: tetratricopeptide repeat protein [Chitinophagales bacterium]|nr:tetratricopeptide repeat protein [Chitinophagales bacterium]
MQKASLLLFATWLTLALLACTSPKRFIEQGLKDLKNHHYGEAVNQFSEALKIESRNTEALMGRGKAWYFMDNDSAKSDDKAYLDFQRVTFIAPENAVAFAWAANAKRKLKQNTSMNDLIEKALKIDPNCAIAHCIQARIFLDEQKQNEALNAIHRAIQLDSTDAYIWHCKGLVHNEKEEYDKAIDAFNKAITLDPYFAKSYENKGVAKINQKKYFDAIEDYTRAIDLDPLNSAYTYARRGRAKAELKRYEDAIADYNKSISMDSSNAWAYFNRAYAKGELKQHQAAIEDYDRVIALDPKDDMAYKNRAYEYKQFGKRAQIQSVGVGSPQIYSQTTNNFSSNCMNCRGTCKSHCTKCSGAGRTLEYGWETRYLTEYDPISGQTQTKEVREYLPSNATCNRCNGTGRDSYVSCLACRCGN